MDISVSSILWRNLLRNNVPIPMGEDRVQKLQITLVVEKSNSLMLHEWAQ